MNGTWLNEVFVAARPIVGMVHIPPLPGAPRYGGDMRAVREVVLRDAEALVEGGIHGLLLENFGDAPFWPRRVPAIVVTHMTALAVELRRLFPVPLGVNVLRNDGRSALAVAHAAGAQFIRVNVLCGTRLTDQGILEGIAPKLLRDRVQLGAAVKILADVDVKHSAPLALRPIGEEAEEMLDRGGADGLIVSGVATGRPADPAQLRAVRAAARGAPLLVGSGVTAENLGEYLDCADGFIVGTSLKRDGDVSQPIDPARVKALMAIVGR
jgi:membrane complex biogenesis BtpA family protein